VDEERQAVGRNAEAFHRDDIEDLVDRLQLGEVIAAADRPQ
jgi:hypothetical protein